MRSQTIYSLLVITLIVMVGVVVWMTVKFNLGYYLVLVEVLSVVVIALMIKLYQRTVKPLRTIIRGVDLLKSQDFNSRLQHVKQPDADRVVDLFNKMLEQLKEERLKLREKNQILDILIDSSSMGVIMLDLDGNIAIINPAALQIFSLESEKVCLGGRISELEGVIAEELVKLPSQSSKIINLDDANIYKCTKESFIVNGYSHSFYLIEKMTEELLLAQKRTYEKVIRMISHEVNNSMAGVSSMLDLINSEISEDRDGGLATLLSTSSERCLNLSRFITRFADLVKIPDPSPVSMSLDRFILNSSRVLESVAVKRNIKFVYNLDSEGVDVKIDPILMEQVVINIVKNGIEAIEDEGVIEITTAQHPLRLIISNNGTVIDSTTQQNLFLPFFSTKLNGQGIGLIVVREILKRHHCRFSLKSYSDGMTRFTILF